MRPPGNNDNFAFVWEGNINIKTPGVYTFETISDDGSKLYFNSTVDAAVNNDGLHAASSKSGLVNIPAVGSYPITITFFEKDGGEVMEVYWSGPGIPRQLIPSSAFIPTAFANTPAMSQPLGKDRGVGMEIGNGEIRKVYPNPFTESFNIDFYNSAGTNDINVAIYDLKGGLLYMHHAGNAPAGNTTLKVNLGGRRLPWGMYLVRLNINGKPSKMIRLVKAER